MKLLRDNQDGFTLMELLTYIAAVGVLLFVIYSVYYQISRSTSVADKTLLSERSAFNAVRILQADIRRSAEVMDAYGPFSASEGALILLIDRAGDAEEEIVIYRRSESEDTLLRHETKAGSSSDGVSSRSIGYLINGFDFSTDEKNANLLRVSVSVKTGRFGVLRNRPLTFHALMRNG